MLQQLEHLAGHTNLESAAQDTAWLKRARVAVCAIHAHLGSEQPAVDRREQGANAT